MQSTQRYWMAAGIGFFVAIVAAFGWFNPAKAPVTPAVPVETTVATSTDTRVSTEPVRVDKKPFTINPQDTIASWSFNGAYTGNDALIAKANAEIARLSGLVGTGEYSDYVLYVSIANQYDLLGDAQSEFTYLQKALALDSTTTGLAWHNAGQLFTRLGAYATARTAFEQAVAVQPVIQYQQVLRDFLKAHYPGE